MPLSIITMNTRKPEQFYKTISFVIKCLSSLGRLTKAMAIAVVTRITVMALKRVIATVTRRRIIKNTYIRATSPISTITCTVITQCKACSSPIRFISVTIVTTWTTAKSSVNPVSTNATHAHLIFPMEVTPLIKTIISHKKRSRSRLSVSWYLSLRFVTRQI